MKTKFKLFESVIADRDIVEPDLAGPWGAGKPGLLHGKPAVLKGTHGAVVEIFERTGGIAVESFDEVGETVDLAFINESYVRTATQEELKERARLMDQLYPSHDS
jgi:hypothetical protein